MIIYALMKRLVSVLAQALLAACALGVPSAAQDTQAGGRPLEIYFVDVEGGAATLIVTPAGESLLVDSGWQRDDGRDARRIHHAAQQAGLKRIDHLLTTHFHRDHFGGVGALSKLIPIGKFYDHGRRDELSEDTQNFPKLNAAYLAAAKGQTQKLRPGEEIRMKQASGAAPIRLQVVASDGEVMQLKMRGAENPECKEAELQNDDPTDNARSVGILLTFGKFRFLDMGDLTGKVERELVCPSNVIGTVDLYQVTHHGMNISNNPVLLRSVKPQVAVMNNGPRKGGHPDVLKWLRSVGSLQDIYQVHRNLDTKDEENVSPELIANLGTEEECSGHLIKVSVAADGSSYIVTNGRTGQSRRYLIRN